MTSAMTAGIAQALVVLALCTLTLCCVLLACIGAAPGELTVSPDCVMALGGGAALRGGTFTHFTNPALCQAQLNQYFEPEGGVYYQQVQHVASAAIAYMQNVSRAHKPSPDQVFVFDIDETALSNAVEWMTPPGALSSSSFSSFWRPWRKLAGSPAHEPSPREVPRGTWAGLPAALMRRPGHVGDALDEDRPPLYAIRDLYWWLLEHNYSVAFITGRKESARAATALNLLTAGYGGLCPDASASSAAAAAGGAAVSKRIAPCYVALHLRDEDDDRPASVYKPERRQALQDQGYTLVGNAGDQFSDLEGLYQAHSSWKLPNPMYLIL